MALKERISGDLIVALKAREKERALVLRTLNAAIKNAEIAKRLKLSKSEEDTQKLIAASVLNDEEVIDVIATQIKQRRDSVVEYEKGNRADLVANEKREIDILAQYMPEQMSEEDLRKAVASAIAKTGAASPKEMGRVMAVLMKEVKGKADGTLVSKIVKELLSK